MSTNSLLYIPIKESTYDLFHMLLAYLVLEILKSIQYNNRRNTVFSFMFIYYVFNQASFRNGYQMLSLITFDKLYVPVQRLPFHRHFCYLPFQ